MAAQSVVGRVPCAPSNASEGILSPRGCASRSPDSARPSRLCLVRAAPLVQSDCAAVVLFVPATRVEDKLAVIGAGDIVRGCPLMRSCGSFSMNFRRERVERVGNWPFPAISLQRAGEAS